MELTEWSYLIRCIDIPTLSLDLSLFHILFISSLHNLYLRILVQTLLTSSRIFRDNFKEGRDIDLFISLLSKVLK